MEGLIMTLAAKQNKTSRNPIPTTFMELQKKLFVLRPIHTKADYGKALKIASDLTPRTDLNREQTDYLKVLASNIQKYEKKHIVANTQTPLEILKFLMSENGLSGSALGNILGTRTLGPAILSGKRGLSKSHIKKLADYFSVEPSLFL